MLAISLIYSRGPMNGKLVVTYTTNSTMISSHKGGPEVLIGE